LRCLSERAVSWASGQWRLRCLSMVVMLDYFSTDVHEKWIQSNKKTLQVTQGRYRVG
jgi:hypothetical protein